MESGTIEALPGLETTPGALNQPVVGRALPHSPSKRLVVVSGSSHRELAAKIADHLGVELGPVTLKTFADGESYVRFEDSVRGADMFVKFWVGVDPTGGTDAAAASVQWSAESVPGAAWTQISKLVQTSTSDITLFIKAQNTHTSQNRNAYFDDAALTDDGPGTPPPPTITRAPATLTPSCSLGGTAPDQNFTVQNTGGDTLNYSITERETETRLLPMAADRGLAVLVNRPFMNGAYFRRLEGTPLPEWTAEFGCATWAQFSLKYILAHPAVTCVLTETTDPAHMAENALAAAGGTPDEAARARMRELIDGL